MKTIQIEIPEGKKAEWVNGVLTLVDDKPIEYKFKVGDKVMVTVPNSCPQDAIYEITELMERNGEPLYEIKCKGVTYKACERYLKLAPQDITERIKFFEDARKWCRENNHNGLVEQYYDARNVGLQRATDILAYLKLRIITAALNEGWEPTFTEDERRYYCICNTNGEVLQAVSAIKIGNATPWTLYFKSQKLAEYAATQFADIYADFCGCKKGGEE